MTFTPSTVGSRRTHPFLDVAGHGFYPYASGASTYVPELPFRLLSVLARYDPDTVVPYETIARVMYPDTPYDASLHDMVQRHLAVLRSLMSLYGNWLPRLFKVEYGVGIRVQSQYLPPVLPTVGR